MPWCFGQLINSDVTLLLFRQCKCCTDLLDHLHWPCLCLSFLLHHYIKINHWHTDIFTNNWFMLAKTCTLILQALCKKRRSTFPSLVMKNVLAFCCLDIGETSEADHHQVEEGFRRKILLSPWDNPSSSSTNWSVSKMARDWTADCRSHWVRPPWRQTNPSERERSHLTKLRKRKRHMLEQEPQHLRTPWNTPTQILINLSGTIMPGLKGWTFCGPLMHTWFPNFKFSQKCTPSTWNAWPRHIPAVKLETVVLVLRLVSCKKISLGVDLSEPARLLMSLIVWGCQQIPYANICFHQQNRQFIKFVLHKQFVSAIQQICVS